MKKTEEIINKIMQLKEYKWTYYILIVVIGLILSIWLIDFDIRASHDGSLHFLRVLGTSDTLSIGQIPAMINQNYCNGFGYSMNIFYQPLVTYIPLFIKLFTPTYMMALKVFAALCIVLSGITMYRFVYQVTDKKIVAFLAAIFYMIAPYKLSCTYVRFAIGEFTSFVFLPLTFLGIYNLFNQKGDKHYYIAIGAAGLLLSHTITTVYVAIFAAIYVACNIKKLLDKEIIMKCLINVTFILLISLMFWLPLLETANSAEYAILNDDIMRTNPSWTSDKAIDISDLFKTVDEDTGISFLTSISIAIGILLTIFNINKIDKKYIKIYVIFLLFALFSVFMATKYFPWEYAPSILCKLQYPWRMLGFFIFFISFVCGLNLYHFIRFISKKDSIRFILMSILIILMIIESVINIRTTMRVYGGEGLSEEEYETAIIENKKISHFGINREYLPIRALVVQKTYLIEREDRIYILSGNVEVIQENKENLNMEIEIKNAEKEAIIEFPYFYYVGYEAIIETEESTYKLKLVESENGFISCSIPEDIEEGIIKIKYKGTAITYASYITSFISLIIFVIYIIYEKRRKVG